MMTIMVVVVVVIVIIMLLPLLLTIVIVIVPGPTVTLTAASDGFAQFDLSCQGCDIEDFDDADAFSRTWTSFDEVRAGDLIGTRHDGEAVRAEADGRIVFPNAAAQPGQEWFYVARPQARFR